MASAKESSDVIDNHTEDDRANRIGRKDPKDLSELPPSGTSLHKRRRGEPPAILTVGVSSIFRKASLGIAKEHSVKVSEIFQEAFIKVDEEGATAGAFTDVTTKLLSGPIPFNVNRPFLYAILHDDIVLFAGTYTH